MLSVYACLKMKVRRSGSPGTTGQTYWLTRFYDIAGFNEVFGIMTVYGLQTVVMTYHNYISVGSVGLGHPHYAIEGRQDRVVGNGFNIHPCMPSFATGKRQSDPG